MKLVVVRAGCGVGKTFSLGQIRRQVGPEVIVLDRDDIQREQFGGSLDWHNGEQHKAVILHAASLISKHFESGGKGAVYSDNLKGISLQRMIDAAPAGCVLVFLDVPHDEQRLRLQSRGWSPERIEKAVRRQSEIRKDLRPGEVVIQSSGEGAVSVSHRILALLGMGS